MDHVGTARRATHQHGAAAAIPAERNDMPDDFIDGSFPRPKWKERDEKKTSSSDEWLWLMLQALIPFYSPIQHQRHHQE